MGVHNPLVSLDRTEVAMLLASFGLNRRARVRLSDLT
jgi:hypothetical protein